MVAGEQTTYLSNGFENNFTGWTGKQGSATIVSAVKYNGQYSLSSKSSFSFSYKTLPNVNNVIMDFYVRFDDCPDSHGEKIIFGAFMEKEWRLSSTVGLTNIGGKVCWTVGNAGTYSFSNIMANPKINTWYNVRLQLKCGASGTGNIRVFVNNIELTDITKTGITTSYSSVSMACVGMVYCCGWSPLNSVWLDNVNIYVGSSPSSLSTSLSQSPSLTPSPTLYPSPSISPIQSSVGVLPLTGLGTDYALRFDDGSVERWITEGMLSRLTTYKSKGYTVARLGFEFGKGTCMSTLNYAKFDRVLEIFNSASIKVIPTSWDDQTLNSAFLSNHKSNWLNFVSHYKGDDRIAAISLFNEPTSRILSSSMNKAQFLQYSADLIRSIHTIDPTRVCIFPMPALMYSTAQLWLSDLAKTGIMSEPNVVFDIAHPYFFENDFDQGMTPEQKAKWYGKNWLAPAVAAFGASRCWGGETFAWVGEKTIATENYPSHTPNAGLQKRWLVAMINEYDRYNVGFIVWCSLGGQKWSVFVDAADEVTYGQ